ncbi:hypothetical protein FRC17_006218 [Serendipita sp. 399]|nr:hypothetical protein FRC17_006218 [Serendipita sp. 399]
MANPQFNEYNLHCVLKGNCISTPVTVQGPELASIIVSRAKAVEPGRFEARQSSYVLYKLIVTTHEDMADHLSRAYAALDHLSPVGSFTTDTPEEINQFRRVGSLFSHEPDAVNIVIFRMVNSQGELGSTACAPAWRHCAFPPLPLECCLYPPQSDIRALIEDTIQPTSSSGQPIMESSGVSLLTHTLSLGRAQADALVNDLREQHRPKTITFLQRAANGFPPAHVWQPNHDVIKDAEILHQIHQLGISATDGGILSMLLHEYGEDFGGNKLQKVWVLMQAQTVLFDEQDVFLLLTNQLRPIWTPDLHRMISDQYSRMLHILKPISFPNLEGKHIPPFFCVLDEVQVTAGRGELARTGEFISNDNRTNPPFLREIWRAWTDALNSSQLRLIVAGRGLDSVAINSALSSAVCKPPPFRTISVIGSFDDTRSQDQYLQRCIQVDWTSPSWNAFLSRAHIWFWGRYQFTAFLVALIVENGFESPHRIINQYVESFSGFKPTDGEYWINQEPELPVGFSVENHLFSLQFGQMDLTQQRVLSAIVHKQLLYGRFNVPMPRLIADPLRLVEAGFARYIYDADGIVINEPLAILSARDCVKRTPGMPTPSELVLANINRSESRRNGFEAYLAMHLLDIFAAPRRLDDVFTFRSDFISSKRTDFNWRMDQFELVTVVASENGVDPDVFVVTPTSGPSCNFGTVVDLGDQLIDWISSNQGRYAFCFPPEEFGPDILFFLRSKKSGKVVLVMLQAKGCNADTQIGKDMLIEGVRSVSPAWFGKRRHTRFSTANRAPFLDKGARQAAKRTKDALSDIRNGLKLEGARYPILRVFASYPGRPGLERTLTVGKPNGDNSHPLAILDLEAFKGISKSILK